MSSVATRAVRFADPVGARGFATTMIIMPFPSEAGRTRAS
jgi:hypothetical protein